MKFKTSIMTYATHSYIDFTADAGTASVNASLGEYFFRHLDMEMGEGTFKMGLSHIYNNYCHISDTHVGNNWKLNIQQYIKRYDKSMNLEEFNEKDYLYIDGDGYIHRFVQYDGNRYLNTFGNGMTLIVYDDSYQIEDLQNNVYYFNSEGNLIEVSLEADFNQIRKIIEYDNLGRPIKYYDNRREEKRKFTFEYKNSLLYKISLISSEKELESVYYIYDGTNLKGIYHFINNALAKVALFKYDLNNNLIFATATPNGVALKFTPSNNNIVVEKGVSKLYLKSFDALNDDLYPQKDHFIQDIEPEIGYKQPKQEKGDFLVKTEDDGLYHLGEVLTFESFQDESIVLQSYESFGITANSLMEKTTFNYYLTYSTIKSGKNIEYRYYRNKKGFVTGVFEVCGKRLKTLTKDNGISIMPDKPQDFPYETINNKSIVKSTIGKSIYCLDHEDKNCGEFFGGKNFNFYRESEDSRYINFVVSFWINVSCTNASYMKVQLKIFHINTIVKEVSIDRTANNAWQYVTIPFSIIDSYQSKTCDVYSALIDVLTDGTGSYQISNFRIKEGEISKLMLSKASSNLPSISEFYSLRLQFKNGSSKTILLNNENYLTDSDILYAYKNRMIKKGSEFDFIYCGNTKRVANVSKVYFRIFENIDYTGLNEEYELLEYGIKYSTYSPDNSCIVNKSIYFMPKEIKEYNEVSGNKSNFGGNFFTRSDYHGRTLETVDSYGKKTVNEYDLYGNLISTTTALSDDFDYNNKVKSGKKRFYTRYIYDDESENGRYRELVVDIKVENSSIKIKKNSQILNAVDSIQVGNDYWRNFSYDFLNRVVEQSISFDFNKKVYNHFEYDSLGRIKTVTDNEKYKFGFEYDIYGNIKKYYLDKNNGILNIKSKTSKVNGSIYGGDLYEETNHLTNTTLTTENDKYGRPKKLSQTKQGVTTSVNFDYQKQDDPINNSKFYTNLAESESIGKIKYINDNFDSTKTTFFYDNNNDACGYKIEKDNKEILRVQQMDSNSTKYVIGKTNYKTTVEQNKIYFDPRITKTQVFDDPKADGKDEWNEVKKYSFSYEYDNILEVVKKKSNSESSLELNYVPKDNTVYYSNSVQSSIHKLKNLTYQFDYSYDENDNIKRVHSTKNGSTNIYYSYDKLNRLKTEYNHRHNIDYTYSYLDDSSKDINRVSKVLQGLTKVKEYKYDHLNRLTHYYKNNNLVKQLKYHEDNLLPYNIIKNGKIHECTWTGDNLLKSFNTTNFSYNYQGNRVLKSTKNGQTVNYYYDGSKLLGEDYSNGVKLRYMYDLMGISGVRYIAADGNSIDYDYAKDGQGNVVAVIRDGVIVTEYFYDAFGNTKVSIVNSDDPMALLNPIRFKCYYYDSETEMYFICGRYYDPELCSYIDTMDIENIINSSNTIGALNLNAICIDNPTDFEANSFTVLTNTQLMPDPIYDPLAGYSWWDRNWKSVVRYGLFALTLSVSIILMCIPSTQVFGIAMFKTGLKFAISGAIVGGIFGGIVSAVQGNDFFKGISDEIITGFVDGFTLGATLYCVSSAVSAIGKNIKASNQTVTKMEQCFVAGTLVLTEEGYKKIEEVELGDKVWSWCEETGEKVLNKVTNLFRNQTQDLVHLFIAGEQITTTLEHPFYVVDYGWKKACELVENDKVVLYNDTIVEVETISIEHTEELVEVFNFEVEDAHTYYVTDKGILVHNMCLEGAINKAKKNNIEVISYEEISGEFTDDSLDLIRGLQRTSDGSTISNHVTGTKIHKGFMDNGKYIEEFRIRVDGLNNGILYELKPRNVRSIVRAIPQMKRYQNLLGNVKKLVLVLY